MHDPTENRFLQAIQLAPEDPAPRLIFADWLEERGDPRADLIRVQCELAAADDHEPRAAELRRQEQTLLDRYEQRWLDSLPSLSGVEWGIVQDGRRRTFSRGIVSAATVKDAATFFRHAEQLFQAGCVRKLWFRDLRGRDCSALFESPYLNRLDSLDLQGNDVGDLGAMAAAKSPYLRRLTSLNFGNNWIGPLGAEALAESRSLVNLRTL
ncbi:MAG: TIGR02996 domain-containing protein, partial [Planctomycetales bacterium]